MYVGDDVVIYAQKGRTLPAAFVSDVGDAFDDQIYPTLTQVLGPVPDPGIDGQHRVVILLYDFGDAHMVGAFDPADVDPFASSAGSNRRDMFTLNLGRVLTDPEKAKSACAHELAHLILYNCDFLDDSSPNREYEGDAARWVEEGVAMYAELACGLGANAEDQLRSFELASNKNLTVLDGTRTRTTEPVTRSWPIWSIASVPSSSANSSASPRTASPGSRRCWRRAVPSTRSRRSSTTG